MQILKKHGIYIVFPLAVLLATVSCSPDADAVLGNGMHKNNLHAGYEDAFPIEAYSVADDSIILQNASWVLLGSSYSDVFGAASYNLAVQLLARHPNNNENNYCSGSLDHEINVDSVILYLPYSGVFPTHKRMDGRELTLSVYTINAELKDGTGFDSAYSSNYPIDEQLGKCIAEPAVYYPKPLDTVRDEQSKIVTKPLKIRLKDDFGRELMEIMKNMPESERNDLSSLPKYFNGIYIKTDPCGRSEDNSIVFSVSNLFSDGAMIKVFYNGYVDGENIKTSFQNFILGPLRFTHVKRDRNLSSDDKYKAQMASEGDTASGGEKLYLEASGGSRIRFKLPDFTKMLSDSAGRVKKVVLNRAVIVLENVYKGTTPDISLPEQLVCLKYVNRGTVTDLPAETNADGKYDKNKGQYRINITRYLQQILYHGTVDSVNYECFNDYIDIVPSTDERYEEPVRAVFYGPKSTDAPERKMRLEVIYTEINE